MNYFSILSLFLIVLLPSKTLRLSQFADEKRAAQKSYEAGIREMSQLQKEGKIMALQCYIPFTVSPFVRDSGEVYEKIIFPDLSYLSYQEFGHQEIIDKYGFSPLDFKAMYRFISENEDELLIYSEEGRVKLLEDYYQKVYNLNLDFVKYKTLEFDASFGLYKVDATDITQPSSSINGRPAI